MVSAQDDLMLVVAENAALEFAGYGHGGPLVSCAAPGIPHGESPRLFECVRCLSRSDQADPCLTNRSMLRTILSIPGLLFPWFEFANAAKHARPNCCSQHDHDRPGVLSPEQPLPAGLVALAKGAPRQQVPAARHRRGRGPAAAFYLRAAAATTVR